MKPLIIFSDIHFGEHGNSDEFNNQCVDFIKYLASYNKEHFKSTADIVFCGDWFHVRAQTNNKTLTYASEGLKLLCESTSGTVYMIVGNHDLYYSDKRDVSPILNMQKYDNLKIINEPLLIDLYNKSCDDIFDVKLPHESYNGKKCPVLMCPWLVNDETLPDLIKKNKPKYVFGHFELPSFWLNQHVQSPGELNWKDYKSVDRIISGHYHKRQAVNNIVYVGNPFGHNFADENDWMNKGFAILDIDTNEIQYQEWADAPKYLKAPLSVITQYTELLNESIHVKIINDMNLQPSQMNDLLNALKEQRNVSDATFVSPELQEENQSVEKLEHIDDINVLITTLISGMKFENLDTNKLIDIYNSLEN